MNALPSSPAFAARKSPRQVSFLAKALSTIVTLMGIAGLLSVVTTFRAASALRLGDFLDLLTGCFYIALGTSIWKQDERAMRCILALIFGLLGAHWLEGVFTPDTFRPPWSKDQVAIFDGPRPAWVKASIAAVWLILALGFWRAADGSRLLCSVWAWAWIAYNVCEGIVHFTRTPPSIGPTEIVLMIVALPVVALPFLALATYGQRDRTIRHFAQVRDARART